MSFWNDFTKGLTLGLCDSGGCGSGHTHDLINPSNDRKRENKKLLDGIDQQTLQMILMLILATLGLLIIL